MLASVDLAKGCHDPLIVWHRALMHRVAVTIQLRIKPACGAERAVASDTFRVGGDSGLKFFTRDGRVTMHAAKNIRFLNSSIAAAIIVEQVAATTVSAAPHISPYLVAHIECPNAHVSHCDRACCRPGGCCCTRLDQDTAE